MTEITYRFHLPDHQTFVVQMVFDPVTFEYQGPSDADHSCSHPPPEWTKLGFQQCNHCPLAAADHPYCPFAKALDGFIARFDSFYSYEMAVVEVTSDARTVVTRQPLQAGMASIIGLIGATCGCPHLAFYRPMARFHLPFATEQETLFRVFGTHLLAEYLRLNGTGECITLETLHHRAQAVAVVNGAMANRLRAAFSKDVVVNAIIILDCFAQAVPWIIDKGLRELRPLFQSST